MSVRVCLSDKYTEREIEREMVHLNEFRLKRVHLLVLSQLKCLGAMTLVKGRLPS